MHHQIATALIQRSSLRDMQPSVPPALAAGFLPAFQHRGSGEVRLCQLADGRIACMHLLDSLPAGWVSQWDQAGRPVGLVPEVRAGYLRGADFWSLADVRHPALDG